MPPSKGNFSSSSSKDEQDFRMTQTQSFARDIRKSAANIDGTWCCSVALLLFPRCGFGAVMTLSGTFTRLCLPSMADRDFCKGLRIPKVRSFSW